MTGLTKKEQLEEVIDKLYQEAVTEFNYEGTKEEFAFLVSNYAIDSVKESNQPNRAARRAMKRGC